MSEEWWNGVGSALLLILVIAVGVVVFNVNRPRLMDYYKEQKTCVIVMAQVQDCYPKPKVE